MSAEILSPEKLEAYIKQYKVTKLHEIGTKRYYCNLLKLHQVASFETSNKEHETIKDAFLKYSKVGYLIKDLITISVWKEKVLPELMRFRPKPNNSLPTYIVLYQETVLAGLLQFLLSRPAVFRYIPNSFLTELIDYCVYKFTTLPANIKPSDANLKLGLDALEDIEKHDRNFSFIVVFQCISVLRFICENLDNLPLNVATRIYTTHDIPILIIHLFDSETWSKRIDGKLYKFNGSNWQQWSAEDAPLSETEIQILLLIFQLLVKSVSTNVYSFNNYRKEQFSRLLKYLVDKVVDKLNILSDLKRWLLMNTLTTEQSPRKSNRLLLEFVSEYREALYSKYEGKWMDIALDSSKLMFYADSDERKEISEVFSHFIDNTETRTCLMCFNEAEKKCSKCKNAWYCSRRCQVEHWSAHKRLCKLEYGK